MARCEVCGNDYDKTFTITQREKVHTFDCFECAVQALAPVCKHCACKIIGHGVEAAGSIFCCVNCASKEGVHGLMDRTDTGLVGTR